MSDTGGQTRQRMLLHIANSFENAEAVAIEQWALDSGLEVERCGDVYNGLALALENSSSPFPAIAICVAGMPPEQFEFFELTSRARRELAVLVYSAKSPERVVRALQVGATGLATREAILTLATRIKRLGEVVNPSPPAMDPIEIQPPGATPPMDRIVVSPVETDPQVKVEAKSTKDHLDSPNEARPSNDENVPGPAACRMEPEGPQPPSGSEVRVPWLRYNGGPARVKPGAAEDRPAQAPAPAEAEEKKPESKDLLKECDDEPSYEPLLSEQELAALLGDDFDDVLVREREMLTGESDGPGSGQR